MADVSQTLQENLKSVVNKSLFLSIYLSKSPSLYLSISNSPSLSSISISLFCFFLSSRGVLLTSVNVSIAENRLDTATSAGTTPSRAIDTKIERFNTDCIFTLSVAVAHRVIFQILPNVGLWGLMTLRFLSGLCRIVLRRAGWYNQRTGEEALGRDEVN